ncbi:trafficking protein particle complex subunit 2 [Thecamonas trahens ATCC 50062]|uniref:Trafficking protein particle complex subunit 2 n=1 Tax=Thecamonas trahens ATCC 50062 TaxID=461836 RepID=A0A0L0DEJ2_THETB|nr:trafficking protein particle complex subunit 2 [Thecamonas trahens ATCC 50062]KNC49748.1 trafficking protein particle complex subunit 2 [Thecamonas trahens ATCC 50062]|eukprot:XP_013757534.1 trafficking protein particle complex subunit 2 [Thecamonas trahens ATCC 50062]
MNSFFVMVGSDDTLLFENQVINNGKAASLASVGLSSGMDKADQKDVLTHFVLFSALDVVDEEMWRTQNMFLRKVDKFEEWEVSAFVTAGNIRFLILHDARNDDGIRTFFTRVYDLYMKMALNPFYKLNSPITSPSFAAKVRALADEHL